MQIEIASVNNPTSPYIQIASDADLPLDGLHNPSLKATLNNTLVVAIDRTLDALHRHRFDILPPVIGSLDLETGGFATQRLVNMLCAYQRLMQDDEHADVRERLSAAFHPKESWVAGQRCITTPALLLIKAILYSHAEWFRPQVHEAYSALRAYNELIQQDFAREDAEFVALIIAHQTLLRAAWYDGSDQDPREVIPFYREPPRVDIQFYKITNKSSASDIRIVNRLVGKALA